MDPNEAARVLPASQTSSLASSASRSYSSLNSSSSLGQVPSLGQTLSVKYLEGHTNKKDLVHRLRKMANLMQHVNEDSPEWKSPEMDALCQGLIQLVNHRDKEVRLYTVLLCMELFSIYAPDAPWDNKESLDIFRQTIRQLASLAHTTKPNQSHFAQYLRILELLAEVKIGIVLVELTKQEPATRNNTSHASQKGEDPLDEGGMDEHHNSNHKSQQDQDEEEEVTDVGVEAMAVLKELIRTMLQSVQLDHPPEIAEMVQKTITSCLEEYYEGVLVPTTLLDELLVCIGQGRTVLVTNPAFSVAVAQRHREQQQPKSGSKKQDKKSSNNTKNLPPLPPRQMEQVNPAYIVAASVVRKSVDRLSTPIATLLNGLLNGDPRTMEESDLLVHTEEPASNDLDKPESDRTSTAARSSSTPIPLLLDTPQPQQQSPTTTVWTVILEFHKIAPSILTTVIGTVATHLTCPDESKRCLVVRLLGRLFVSKHSTMAVEYSRCLSEWLKRIHDISPKIRSTMVDYLLKLVVLAADRSQNQSHNHASDWKEIWERAQSVLGGQLDVETDASVRLHVLHQVCDTAYAHRQVIAADLLRRVAHRVTSKHKQERRDALTGLAQTYFKQYVSHQLRLVQEGGDDVELSVILQVLHRTCASDAPSNQSSRKNSSASATISEDHEAYDCYQWIPRTVMKCACYKDSVDTEMHSRVVQVVDDLLLGSELSNSTKMLTPTARAVGLAFVIDSLQQQSPSSHPAVSTLRSSTSKQAASAEVNDGLLWLCYLMAQRSKLQKALGHYLDARSQVKLHPRGSEEALTANANAEDLLETVAGLTAPTTCNSQNLAPGERQPILQRFHALKDKHIFRILSTIVSPTHSTSARIRALDEVPKRVKQQQSSQKNAAGSNSKSDEDGLLIWVRTLVRRCAMGDFINAETIHHCILLAQECFHEEDIVSCRALVGVVKIAADHFPELCVAKDESFTTLIELFTDARSLHKGGSFQKEVQECGLMTALSAILASAAPASTTGQTKSVIGDNLNGQLINLCVRDGTPDQARHAVITMSALLNPKHSNLLTQEQNDAFAPLLKTLTLPSRLSPSDKGKSTKLVCVLISLAELAECAPSVFHGSARGQKAIQFALEMVLLGRAQATSDNEGESEDSSDEDEKPEAQSPDPDASNRRRKTKSTTPAASKKSGVKHASPGTHVGILEDESLSLACRTLCAAIEFLVSFIRHSIVSLRDSTFASRQAAVQPVGGKENNPQGGGHTTDGSGEKKPGSNAAVGAVSETLIGSVFDVLTQILHDQGLPPSTQDRRDCKLRQDRAALRQCSAIHLLRLCDPRLSLEHKFLIPAKWHILAGAFLDDERVVRDKVMEEYGFMLTGQGKYKGSSGATAPSLRMLSLVTLCTDGDHGMGPSAANGNAANVGKRSTSTKMNATNSIESLRKIYELSAAQHRALGVRGEERFETQMKVMLMPEYMVPYAFHVLAFRRETPGASASKSTRLTETSEEDEPHQVDDGQHRILRKRLKWLFDPLIQSLGESADNISFLIRMTEILEKKFQPQDLSRGSGRKRLDLSEPIPSFGLSPGLDDGEEVRQQVDDVVEEQTQLAAAKLKIICVTAREVLLSHIKKDVNLTTYPGQIQLPAALFRRVPSMRRTASSILGTESAHRSSVARLPQKNLNGILADDSSQEVSSATTASTHDKDSRRSSKRTQGAPKRGVDSLDRNDDSMETNKSTAQSANADSDFARPANRKALSSRSSSDSAASSTVESVARRLRSSRDSVESVDDPSKIVPPERNGMTNGSAKRKSFNDAVSFHDSEEEPHSRRQTRSSNALNSSQESNQSSQRSGRSGVSPGSRSSRVHFSPEVSTRNIPAQSMESSVNEGSPFSGGDDLSPIRMVGSPLPESRAAGTGLLGSGEKTCGTTPPSFLRGATMSATASFDCSTDKESSASDKSENQSATEPLDDSNAYHSDGGMDHDEGDGTKTTSETQSTEEPSHAGTTAKNPTAKKRVSPGKENQSHKRHKASVPAQIKVSRNKPALAVLLPLTSGRAVASRLTRKKTRSSARASMSSNDDSLDFDGGLSGDEAKNAKSTTAARGRATGGNGGKSNNGEKKPVASKKQSSKAKEKPLVSRQRRRRA